MQSGRPIYDFWMNDSDFIGTHPRYDDIVDGSLTDFMENDGQGRHQPGPRPQDFIGLVFGTFTDGKLYQLPGPAIRQPVLVPPRLVPAARAQGGVQEAVRLRSRRAGELVGL